MRTLRRTLATQPSYSPTKQERPVVNFRLITIMTTYCIFLLFLTALLSSSADIFSPPDLSSDSMVETLSSLLQQGAQEIYSQNEPTPHIFIDDMFPEEIVKAVAAEYPEYSSGKDAAQEGFYKSTFNVQNRKMEVMYDKLKPATKFLIAHMQSPVFLFFLTAVTGIDNLMPDPYLYGAGPHQTLSGGHLSIHLDYNYNEQINMWRRVNLFLYLNEDWDKSWGGDLELWDSTMQEAVVKIAPLFNRMVIFTATETSWHGHPDPLQCPPNKSRKSIALYYYTAVDGFNRTKRATDFRPRKNIDRFTMDQLYTQILH